MGSTGHRPVSFGHRPDETARRVPRWTAPVCFPPLALPSGGSPLGTGESPVPPVRVRNIRANVPAAARETARRILAGYYAHGTAPDDCLGELRRVLNETGLADNTILIRTTW
jgi:arylsulfatase A-like enzyme